MIRWLVLALLVPTSVLAQDLEIKVAGARAAEPEVLALVRSYTPCFVGWTSIEERDQKRRPMVAPNYFYHGQDGNDIGFDGLTERHKRNDLRLSYRRLDDVILYQYENTAILTYKDLSRGTDKGHAFEGYGSGAIIMTRTADGWRVAADIMGPDPPPASAPPKEKRKE